MVEKEIKKEIKQLKKIKLSCRAGSKERLELEHRIKALKEQLGAIKQVDEAKKPLVEAILKLEPDFIILGIDLYKHSIKELKYHLDKLNKKARTK